jgi:hypothetical protein
MPGTGQVFDVGLLVTSRGDAVYLTVSSDLGYVYFDPGDPFLRKNTNWPQPGDVQRMFNSTGAGAGCGCSQ